MLRITCEKSPIPMLWLDTSVGIKLAKLEKGEKLQEIEQQRGARLKETLKKLVLAGKLICPEGDQEEEYEAERLEEEVAREFANLSHDIHLRHREGISDSQILIAIREYLRNSEEFLIPAQCFFHRDPVQQLEDVKKVKFIFSVSIPKPTEILKEWVTAKNDITRKFEEIRQENRTKGRDYNAQFQLEQDAFVHTMVQMVTSFREKVASGAVNFMDFMGVQGYGLYIGLWYRLTGKFADWGGLCRVFQSEHFYNLPVVKIRSQLYSELVTGDQTIQAGDSMDVNHLSAVIPVSHYVLTDRKMLARIEKLGIGTEWGCKVFSMSTVEQLIAELQKL